MQRKMAFTYPLVTLLFVVYLNFVGATPETCYFCFSDSPSCVEGIASSLTRQDCRTLQTVDYNQEVDLPQELQTSFTEVQAASRSAAQNSEYVCVTFNNFAHRRNYTLRGCYRNVVAGKNVCDYLQQTYRNNGPCYTCTDSDCNSATSIISTSAIFFTVLGALNKFLI